MSSPPLGCSQCQYEIATFSEAVEALEGGARCLLCGGSLSTDALTKAVDSWSDTKVAEEGALRAEAEADVQEEEEVLFEGTPDFGDDGEDVEDPIL